MKVIYGIGKVSKAYKNSVLAIGVFDGLHIGHQKLIRSAVRRAKAIGGPAIVMTFSPHPVQVLHPKSCMPLVVSLSHRLKLISKLDIRICIVVHFTKRFSKLAASQFIKRYLFDRIHPEEIFVGDDFRFGQNRQGTLDLFRDAGSAYGFKVNAMEAVKDGRNKIGSSRIRQLITDGKLDAAKRFLGRNVAIMGKVARGDGRGKVLGFATANLNPHNQVIPPVGVYAVRVFSDGEFLGGMANVGRRPSFKREGSPINIEVHIFDFKKILYGKEILVEFIKKVRQEKMYGTEWQLVAQLKRDEVRARFILSNA